MEFIGSIRNYPARLLATWYLILIALGSAALLHPRCRAADAAPWTLLESVFTSTSATCVTGLVVRSTANDLSWLGQAVVLSLIQVGGIGIMTITSYVILTLGKPASVRDRAVLAATLGADGTVDIRLILQKTLFVTLLVEAIGFLILAIRNLFAGMPLGEALWNGLFLAISAFSNAGFALHDDSLVPQQGDTVVNLTIMSLVLLGGIGFPVLLDLGANWRGDWRSRWERLTLHSKLMLIGTIALLAIGAISFLILEWGDSLRELPFWKRLLVAMFHSVTCRTAGFNTVEYIQTC